MKEIDIDGWQPCTGGKTLVVAEIGVNHDGELGRALELVGIAADCGADAVKLQIFQAHKLIHSSGTFANYQKAATVAVSPRAMLERYELGDDELREVVDEIKHRKMIPLATPFSQDDVDQIEALQLPAIKIASPDVVNWPLLRRCAQSRLPMLVSTGAANINEISSSVAWLRGWDAAVALLHCVSSYPTPATETNLSWIAEMHHRFELPVGYSDHTTEIIAGALAVSAGACIVEKHITYDCTAKGPDHSASADPREFEQYVQLLRVAEQMQGRGTRRVLDIERDVRNVSRQSLVAVRDLPKGHLLREEDLTVQRPGTGIPAAAFPSMVGLVMGQSIRKGQMLTWQIISDAA
ncbi:MAG: N-acetylneuraminate synthase family protein [Planctomycetota bacterium]|nr:N-acetylneuraminate synthase family protein [Planctomycetota bacterium]